MISLRRNSAGKVAIAVFISALLLLTGADCQGSRPNPRNPSPHPENKWVCATGPVDCPLHSGTQPSLIPLAQMIPLPSPNNQVTRSPAPVPTLPAKVIMSIGDSLSLEPSYYEELSRLMTKTGQPHTWVIAAAGGSRCSYWVGLIDSLITQHHPNVIFLNCGTNDTPLDATEADYTALLTIAQNRGVAVIASYIGRPYMGSPENVVRPYIEGWMNSTNLAIQRALVAHPRPVADMSRIPATPEWLTPDGIHWTWRARAAAGQLFYQAAAPSLGWKTLSQMGMTEMCGLSGAWLGQPWPTNYRMCLS